MFVGFFVTFFLLYVVSRIYRSRQRQPGNLVLRYSVHIKTLSFTILRWILKILHVKWRNITPCSTSLLEREYKNIKCHSSSGNRTNNLLRLQSHTPENVFLSIRKQNIHKMKYFFFTVWAKALNSFKFSNILIQIFRVFILNFLFAYFGET